MVEIGTYIWYNDIRYTRFLESYSHGKKYYAWQCQREDLDKPQPTRQELEQIYQRMLMRKTRENKLIRIIDGKNY